MKKIIYYWLPPILWMGCIFLFSSKTKISVSPDYLINFIFFKSLHVIEYAFLYFLFVRAFFMNHSKKTSSTTIFLFSIILSTIYATTDEFHQTFVNSRQGTFRDIFIDFTGIFLMYIYIKWNLNFLKKFFLWKK